MLNREDTATNLKVYRLLKKYRQDGLQSPATLVAKKFNLSSDAVRSIEKRYSIVIDPDKNEVWQAIHKAFCESEKIETSTFSPIYLYTKITEQYSKKNRSSDFFLRQRRFQT